MSTPHKVTAEFWDHATLWSDDDSLAGHSTDGGRVFGITRTRYVECDRYGCSAVAVIDPEDREQVERLASVYFGYHDGPSADDMQAALREFANPTPPKPPRPTGMGAVVIDTDGEGWVHFGNDCWIKQVPNANLHTECYADIDVVETCTYGVEPLADWERDLLRGSE